MGRDSRYDILFGPLAIGPVVAKNRFYQVPHCNCGGYRDPTAVAEMRRVKAEGGWGVIFTEQCEIHHTSEITPFIELRLWDDRDIPMLAKMAAAMKEHGALAGIEMAYSGINGPNPLYQGGAPGADGAADPDLQQRPGPGAREGSRRHPEHAALVSGGGEAEPRGGIRPDLPLWRARLRDRPALPVARHQPAQRRICRQPGEPRAVRARGGRVRWAARWP